MSSPRSVRALILSTAALFAAASAAPALAGPGHDHGPRHGGVVREVQDVTLELVARPDSLTLYVRDHDQPIATRGARAEAVIHAAGGKTTVTLEPTGSHALAAKGAFRVGLGVRVAVNLSLAGKPPLRATFNLK